MSDLASRLVKFFETNNAHRDNGTLRPRSIHEFYESDLKRPEDALHEIRPICERLCQTGILEPAGVNVGQLPMMGSCYYSTRVGNMEFWRHETYGVFDNLAFGFSHIRLRHEDSVRPIEVSKNNGLDVGSCFFLEENIDVFIVKQNQVIVTARHCIEGMSEINIPGVNWEEHPPIHIQVHSNENIDLAIIRPRDPAVFSAERGFRISRAQILDEVMVMGFPPIPGFNAIQIAEVATIASKMKSTVGQVTTTAASYLNGIEYHLISARTKGGSSGGPVINKAGLLVGVITDHPTDSDGELDKLGYGLATPSERLHEMIVNPDEFAVDLNFSIVGGKLSTN